MPLEVAFRGMEKPTQYPNYKVDVVVRKVFNAFAS
jgi:hypothetical protein